jgi:hypothetical protein
MSTIVSSESRVTCGPVGALLKIGTSRYLSMNSAAWQGHANGEIRCAVALHDLGAGAFADDVLAHDPKSAIKLARRLLARIGWI